MRLHELKSDPSAFGPVWNGFKAFEIRQDDRGFSVNDFLWLREHRPGYGYSGRSVVGIVRWIERAPDWGLVDGRCVMGLMIMPPMMFSSTAESERGK